MVASMSNPKISIRALKAFVAVYEEQSFSKAAERENATQSGMSTQVKNLEIRLGTDLLVRTRKQFDLTPSGRVVYQEGQAILRHLLALEKQVADLAGTASGLITLGMIPTLTRSVLSMAMEGFRAEFPSVELSLVEEYSGSLLRRVMEGEIDFAVVPAGDLPTGLKARFIARDREMLVSRPGELPGLAHMDAVSLSALEGRRLIVPSSRNVRRGQIESTLQAHGVHLAELLEMDGMLATIEMIETSDWMAILPAALCHADRDGRRRQLNLLSDPPMTIDYVIVQKAEMTLSRAGQSLADRIAHATQQVASAFDPGGKIAKAEVRHPK